ncbi:MAG: NAD/NADP octopine/nopaline dehydrogenase family protein [Actinomycetota bacterium]
MNVSVAYPRTRRGRRPGRSERPRFCVLGAGHGGVAMTGHLSILDYEVNLWNRSRRGIDPILEQGGIDVDGAVQGRGIPSLVTCEIGEALAGVDVIMVVIPANGHLEVARLMAPHLQPGQLVVLNPGRTGGALEVTEVFREAGVPREVTVAEAQTFLYIARHTEPARARIFEIKNRVPLAALPASRIPDVLEPLLPAFPQFVPGTNVLETSYGNMGMVFHPAVTILNSAWIESRHDFGYYLEGISPSVSRVLEALDHERRSVANALGVRTISARDWLALVYNSGGRSLYEAVQTTAGYADLFAPSTMLHRYLLEDVPMSLVPTSETGRQYGVATPTIDTIIHLASVMLGCDFRSEGRTLARMGISGMSVKELRRAVGGKGRGYVRGPRGLRPVVGAQG